MGFRPFIGTLFFAAPLNGLTYIMNNITTCSDSAKILLCPKFSIEISRALDHSYIFLVKFQLAALDGLV
jgi:hypothetical protein